MKTAFVELYNRDIAKLKEELSLYKEEKNIWVVEENISNSAGNLCLHLVGNLNHFIGALLGKTGYVRERELEFSTKDVPRSELISMIDQTKETVANALSGLTEADLTLDFPEAKRGIIEKTGYMLIHLLAHLDYHLGQVNYHRRLLDK